MTQISIATVFDTNVLLHYCLPLGVFQCLKLYHSLQKVDFQYGNAKQCSNPNVKLFCFSELSLLSFNSWKKWIREK
jgi:hypothetical protein